LVLGLLWAACQTLPAADASSGGVYRAWTPVPTASPTPAPAGVGVAHFSPHKDWFALTIDGGATVPVGDVSKYNNANAGGSVSAIYGASKDLAVAAMFSYNAMTYKELSATTGASQPMTSIGVSLMAVYTLFEAEKLAPFVEAGLGYFMINRATQKLDPTAPLTPLPTYVTKYEGSAGMGFIGGLGASYAITPNFQARLKMDVVSISLAGGTGDNIMFASPTLGLGLKF